MAPEHDVDVEEQVGTNEQTPLLSSPSQDELLDREDDKRGRATFYALRILWAIVAALILGVFIKGWIDGSSYADASVPESI